MARSSETRPAPLPRRDYTTVTEVVGESVRRDAVEKMWARYSFAATRAVDKDVLEVACGTGQGLGLLARVSRRLVGGDYTLPMLQRAGRHYTGRVALCCLDAQALPFADASFDLLLCIEAVYYLSDQQRFVAEASRVLRQDGELLVVTVNPAWQGFNRSPQSTRYLRATELRELLSSQGFRTELYGSFPDTDRSLVSRLVSLVRRLAVALHLVPKTMRGKRLLKRLFYGRLAPLPPELVGPEPAPPVLTRLSDDGDRYTVVYALATRSGLTGS